MIELNKIYNMDCLEGMKLLLEKGQKISQLVILPILKPEYEEVKSVDELYGGKTERGANGFGSTGL